MHFYAVAKLWKMEREGEMENMFFHSNIFSSFLTTFDGLLISLSWKYVLIFYYLNVNTLIIVIENNIEIKLTKGTIFHLQIQNRSVRYRLLN